MAVTGTTSRNDYVADGSTEYAFTFPAQESSWVQVRLGGVVQGSGFTVALNADQTSSPGGTVTFLSGPAAGRAVRIQRVAPLTQTVKYSAYASFPAATHEAALDKAMMAVQDVDRDLADLAAATAATDEAETTARRNSDTSILATTLAAVAAINNTGHAPNDNASVLAYRTSTPRTLTARFGEILNVKDFGAAGSGVANDGAAIQDALYEAELRGGGVVFLPNGRYAYGEAGIPTMLYVPPGVSLVGESPSVVLSKLYGGWHFATGKPDWPADPYYDPLGNALNGTGLPISPHKGQVRNLTIENGIGAWVIKSAGVLVENIHAGDGAIAVVAVGNDDHEPCQGIIVRDIFRLIPWTGNDWYTVAIYSTDGFELSNVFSLAKINHDAIVAKLSPRGSIRGCVIDQVDSVYGGITLDTSKGIIVEGNHVRRAGGGIIVYAEGADIETNAQIATNVVEECAQGIRLHVKKNDFIGNRAIGCTKDITFVGTPGATDATGNRFLGNNFPGVVDDPSGLGILTSACLFNVGLADS